MKITVNEKSDLTEMEVIINCHHTNEDVLKIISSLRSLDHTITGEKSGQTFLLPRDSILYIESVDKKTFIYCEKEIYESTFRLYEFEERLSSDSFFRASKSTIINLSQVRSLRPDFGGRLSLTMNNSEKMIVSRQYASTVKEKLGL